VTPPAARGARTALALAVAFAAAGSIPPARAQAAAAAPGPETLRLRDALARALALGPEVRAAGEGVRAADTRVDAAGAQRYPRLRAEANVLYWDSPLELAFAAPAAMSGGAAPAPMAMPAPKLLVRDQITSTITVSVAQPLSALVVLNRLVDLERNGAEAARADAGKARLDTAHRVAEAYVRLLQARAFADVARKSLAQVDAQLERAKIFECAGALGRVDVLRLQAAQASARQGVLRAEAAGEIARQGLALAMGAADAPPFDVVDDFPDPPPPVRGRAGDVAARAAEHRPELRALRERAAQAEAGRGVAVAQLFPNVLAVGTYQHAEGMGPFQPKNAWFVGATLQWDVWDWGKTWKGVKEAEARAAQARIGAEALRDQIAFDARRRLLEVTTAYESLDAARAAREAAEEAYRLQSVRFNEGAATTTDVIDAETEVTRARNGYAQARYDYFLAQAALARAVGELPAPAQGVAP
jgi:outer membrane protein